MTATRVEIYKDGSGEFRYTAYAANNRKVGAAEEGYKHLRYVMEKTHDLYPDAVVHVAYDESDYIVDFNAEEENPDAAS